MYRRQICNLIKNPEPPRPTRVGCACLNGEIDQTNQKPTAHDLHVCLCVQIGAFFKVISWVPLEGNDHNDHKNPAVHGSTKKHQLIVDVCIPIDTRF